MSFSPVLQQVDNFVEKYIELEKKYGAQHYKPLPVVLTKGEGIYLWDVEGKRYMDMMSAYSAVSHGHSHPKLVKALQEQAAKLAVVSRSFYTDKLGAFMQQLCQLSGQDKMLPMNTGAEAVETAIKAARKWAYTVKGISNNQAEIIICSNNFHGRTVTIISMSSDKQYRADFGPYTPGFKIIPFGDAAALEQAITPNTAAFLVEPIQGEAGIIIPPAGYLKQCAKICRHHNVLFITDEIQTGMGRTGKFLAAEHEGVQPDAVIMGKALGGGLLPISAFLAKQEVMDVFTPGDHGSTFGGNQLASVVGLMALHIMQEEKLAENSAQLGDYFLQQLKTITHPAIKNIRGKGLFIGMEFDKNTILAYDVCLKLLQQGILSKDIHESIIRFAPPLTINKQQLDNALTIIKNTLHNL